MRLASAFIVAAVLATSPAFAQDATTPAAPAPTEPAAPADSAPAAPEKPAAPPEIPALADISATADRDFWCAIAFSLTSRAAEIAGDTGTAGGEAQKSQILFASIVTSMKAANFAEQQFNALTSQYTARLLDPFAAPGTGFSREVCEAAVPEAQAVIDAAEAAAPPAEPATPVAPATQAPAPEAPAAQ